MKKTQNITKVNRMKYPFLLIATLLSISCYNYIKWGSSKRDRAIVR